MERLFSSIHAIITTHLRAWQTGFVVITRCLFSPAQVIAPANGVVYSKEGEDDCCGGGSCGKDCGCDHEKEKDDEKE